MLVPKNKPFPVRGRVPSASAWTDFTNARSARGLRQSDVAEKVGVHLQAVSHWERGLYPPNRKHWNNLMEHVGLTLDQLASHAANFSSVLNSGL